MRPNNFLYVITERLCNQGLHQTLSFMTDPGLGLLVCLYGFCFKFSLVRVLVLISSNVSTLLKLSSTFSSLNDLHLWIPMPCSLWLSVSTVCCWRLSLSLFTAWPAPCPSSALWCCLHLVWVLFTCWMKQCVLSYLEAEERGSWKWTSVLMQ